MATAVNFTLDQFNDVYNQRYLPATVYISAMMVVGLVGNSVVFHVYLKKFKPSTTRCFILVVALLDILNALVCCPVQIFQMRNFVTFGSSGACRFMITSVTYFSTASGQVLILVAVDRYRKVCRPFQKQMTPYTAKLACGLLCLVLLVLMIPTPLIYGPKTVTRYNVNITICRPFEPERTTIRLTTMMSRDPQNYERLAMKYSLFSILEKSYHLQIAANPIIYGFLNKQFRRELRLISLATFDLITVTICIPSEIADIRHNYTFGPYTLCKILRLLVTFSAIASASTLVAIAVDRYRKICRPFEKQMTPLSAKVTVIVCSLMTVVVSSPNAVIYGPRAVATDDGYINGSDCSTSDDYVRTPYPLIYNGVLFFIFFSSTLSLSVLYGLIWRQVVRQRKRMNAVYEIRQNVEMDSRHEMIPNTSSSDVQCPSVTWDSSLLSSDRSDSNIPARRSERIPDSCPDGNTPSLPGRHPSRCGRNESPTGTSSLRQRGHKTVLMLFLITLVFVLSFLPHLGLMATQAVNKHVFDDLTGAGIAANNLFLRSYFINSASNPIIYSFCNERFRLEVTRLFGGLTRRT
ncbi:cholecystokinin receptor type A-like [Haliotis rubra]|uniref:cholecystokinin receptor type A-like n=1 Tax=Haliotis rubra TaxID=36100 RepID=UPI001EE6364C|nr:cholecystokinin receptor type A-like [Haliotis rubra]